MNKTGSGIISVGDTTNRIVNMLYNQLYTYPMGMNTVQMPDDVCDTIVTNRTHLQTYICILHKQDNYHPKCPEITSSIN